MIRSVQSVDRAWLHAIGHSDAEVERMLHPRHRPLVTTVWQEADGRLLGSASAGPVDEVSGAWVSGMVRVVADAQGRGIGAALVKATLDEARAEGASQIQCYIEPDNISSIRAHQRAGYVRVGAVRSFLVRASTMHPGSPAEAMPKIEEVGPLAFGQVVDAAGYAALVRYFPRLGAASRPPRPRRLVEIAHHLLGRLRRRPSERRLILRGTDRALRGLILMVPGEPRLMTERAQVPQLTVPWLATLEKAVRGPYWPHDPTKGFLLLHDDQATPPPDLVLKTQQVYVA